MRGTVGVASLFVVCAGAAVLWLHSSVAEPDKGVARARWEYRVMRGSEVGELGTRGTAATTEERLSEEAVGKGLDKLGTDGWELVTVVVDPDGGVTQRRNNDRTFYLKRVK